MLQISLLDHLPGHQAVMSDTANEFSTMLRSDQIAVKMGPKRFPKLADTDKTKFTLTAQETDNS